MAAMHGTTDGSAPRLVLLKAPPRHLFFTGKGGVGKTSVACAVAIALADAGRRVLLVSTDPASNLDEMLGVVRVEFARVADDVDPRVADERRIAKVEIIRRTQTPGPGPESIPPQTQLEFTFDLPLQIPGTSVATVACRGRVVRHAPGLGREEMFVAAVIESYRFEPAKV